MGLFHAPWLGNENLWDGIFRTLLRQLTYLDPFHGTVPGKHAVRHRGTVSPNVENQVQNHVTAICRP